MRTSLDSAELASEPESVNVSNGFRLAPVTGRTKGITQQIHRCVPKQGGTTELAKPPSLGKRDGGFCVFSTGSKSAPAAVFIVRIPRNIG